MNKSWAKINKVKTVSESRNVNSDKTHFDERFHTAHLPWSAQQKVKAPDDTTSNWKHQHWQHTKFKSIGWGVISKNQNQFDKLQPGSRADSMLTRQQLQPRLGSGRQVTCSRGTIAHCSLRSLILRCKFSSKESCRFKTVLCLHPVGFKWLLHHTCDGENIRTFNKPLTDQQFKTKLGNAFHFERKVF